MSWSCAVCGTNNHDGDARCSVCGSVHAAADAPTASVPVIAVERPAATAGAGANAGGPAGAGPPGPPASPAPLASSGPEPGRSPVPWIIATVVLLVVVLAGAVAMIVSSDDGTTNDRADATVATVAETEAPGSDQTAGTAAPTDPPATPDPIVTVPPEPYELIPAFARATNERESVTLCNGQFAGYEPERIMDHNLDSGWGASAHDGTGESVTLDFGQSVHLTSVGLTPGFFKVGPRRDTDCQDVSAFPRNRFVTSVEYSFDDGTSVIQDFAQEETVQYRDLDVDTTSVTITILGTVRPDGADDDTVLSEASFEGWAN
ncbi:MAG: hypothetical protein JWO77_2100 [Ilumatobacteraceae bacterium]|nr:hypothetical protein [Ilumatobacteraceae bacterium]